MVSVTFFFRDRRAHPSHVSTILWGTMLSMLVVGSTGCGKGDDASVGANHAAGSGSGASDSGASGASGVSGSAAGAGAASGGTSGAASGVSSGATAGVAGESGSASGVAGSVDGDGTAGSSGAGGSPEITPADCFALTPQPGLTGVLSSGSENVDQQRPLLVSAGDETSADAVALVFSTGPTASPASPLAIEHVELNPWGEFPPQTALVATKAAPLGGTSFVVGPAAGGGFSLLYSTLPSDPPTALLFDDQVKTGETAGGVVVGPDSDTPLFTTSNGIGTLTASESTPIAQHHGITLNVFESGAHYTRSSFACATSPIVADGIPWNGGYLVAYSTSRECCLCDDGMDGPAALLKVSTFSPTGEETILYRVVQAAGDFSYGYVRLLANPPEIGGGWLIAQSANATVRGPYMAHRLGTDAAITGSSIIIGSGKTKQPPAIAPLGTGIGVAWIDDTGDVAQGNVQVVSATGQVSTIVPLNANVPTKVTAVSSKNRQHLLVGWYEQGSSDLASQISLERFDCPGPTE